MKFFHISDLHIGLKLYNRSLAEDQMHVLGQIAGHAEREQPDAILIAGDIYDKAIPSAGAVEMFDWFLNELTEAAPKASIMVISGNHDSAPRLNLYRRQLEKKHIHMIGLPPANPEDHIAKVTLKDEYGPVNFYLLPFVRPSAVRHVVASEDEPALSYNETLRRLIERERINQTVRNVIVSHQFYVPDGVSADSVIRTDTETRTVGNIDQASASLLAPFDYAALGHIHMPMSVGADTIRYCGTPLACSVSEAGQKKSVISVDLGPKGQVLIRNLKLFPLREIKALSGNLEDILKKKCWDYVSVAVTSEADLGLDAMDRLRAAFPNLLEVRTVTDEGKQTRQTEITDDAAGADPLEMCRMFLGEMTGEEERLLRKVLETIEEGEAS